MSLTNNQQLDMIKFLSNNTKNRTLNLLNESVTVGLSDVVLDKMFALTIGKYSKIDFSDIERSRGDITRIKYYDNLRECIDILLDLHSTTDKLPGALVISTALNNFITYKTAFEHVFRVKNNVGIMIYNTFFYAIMEATSYLIASSIDFVKSETDNEYTVNLYTDSKNTMLIDQLVKFNKTIDDGTLMKFIGESEKTIIQEGAFDTFVSMGVKAASKGIDVIKNHPKTTLSLLAAAGVLWLGSIIIPMVRETIYWIYKMRQKISDSAKLQAEFLNTNIDLLRNTNGNEKIIANQEKYIKTFTSIAKTFAIDGDKANRDATKDINSDKIDVSAVVI